MVDNTSFRYYWLYYDKTYAHVFRYNNVVPSSATYITTGSEVRWLNVGGNGQPSVYFGREMWHKKYTHLVSAFTFHKNNLNCLDQTISNYVSERENDITIWANSAVTRETNPAAYSIVSPGYFKVDVTSQVILGAAAGAAYFVEPCTIEVEQDTSTPEYFPQNL